MIGDGASSYLVDLMDGHFEINGTKFFMHEERSLKDFRIIYFRSHSHHLRVHADNSKEEIAHEIVFRMGWQTNDENGNNIQRVMEID